MSNGWTFKLFFISKIFVKNEGVHAFVLILTRSDIRETPKLLVVCDISKHWMPFLCVLRPCSGGVLLESYDLIQH